MAVLALEMEMHDGSPVLWTEHLSDSFVHVLQRQTTKSELWQRFSEYGTIEECSVGSDAVKGPRGFAFVTFHEQASMEKVLIVRHAFHGCFVECKRAMSKEDHGMVTASAAGMRAGATPAQVGGPAPRSRQYSYGPHGKFQHAHIPSS
jgi:hypothetical protein